MFLTTAQFGKIPNGYYAVRISNGKGFGHIDDFWATVAPAPNNVNGGVSREEFRSDYLALLDYRRNNILNELDSLITTAGEAGFRGVALLCYERHGEFCHRKILFDWLKEHHPQGLDLVDEGRTITKEKSE